MSLNDIIAELNKKHKTELVQRGKCYEKVKRIDFSSPRANWMLRGGIPEGRMIEFAGKFSSGKTTLALDIISNAQVIFAERIKGNKVLFVDAENTLDCEWAQKLGVNTEDMFIFTPECQPAEEILQITQDLASSGEFGLIVFDSISFLFPKERLEKDMSEKTVGIDAKLWTIFIRNMTRIQAINKFTFIAMNTPKPQINSQFPGQVYYPGGELWQLACSVRLLFSQGETIDIDGKEKPKSYPFPVGHKIKMNLNKTKICPPSRKEGFCTLNYDDGIDMISDSIDIGSESGLIKKAGAWFTYKDTKVQGKQALKEHFQENEDDFIDFYNVVMDIVKQ